MKVTYISHSGFLIEAENCLFLFDYYEGKIPPLSQEKPLFVFVSHWHSDHFNPEIFSIRHTKVHYILSHDTKKHLPAGISPKNLRFMKPEETLDFTLGDGNEHFTVETLKSTDCGVAFLVHYRRKYIYHAGDLNWWVWPGETKQYNSNMTANFLRYTKPLETLDIWAAFLPLDPRQEEWYSKGFLHVLEHGHVKYAFPMHFWKDYSVISRFLSSSEGSKYQKTVVNIEQEGQEFSL